MLTSGESVLRTGIDTAALKPAECDVREAASLPVSTLTIDYEGREHLPSENVLAELAREKEVYATTPVRADGFDPLGDDSLARRIPDSVGRIAVAGHPAYLNDEERQRSVAGRLKAGVDAAREAGTDAWVGTESVERLALATGATQFELLSRSTERDLRALRAAGFEGEVAVYAPTVLTDDEDAVLDAVGAYVSRRRPVANALPENDDAVDGTATGRAREVLSAASRDFALVGSPATVAERVAELERAGANRVVGYPARGIDEFRD